MDWFDDVPSSLEHSVDAHSDESIEVLELATAISELGSSVILQWWITFARLH